MKFFRGLITSIILLVCFVLIFPQRADAYLDPGTGSFILQLLMASILGALFTIKLYWRKVKSFFADLFSKKGKDID